MSDESPNMYRLQNYSLNLKFIIVVTGWSAWSMML